MPPQASSKHFEFTGNASGFFVAWIVVYFTSATVILIPLGFNFFVEWFVKNIKVDGRSLSYKAGFGESFVFLLVSVILLMLTIGIYGFWFAPKLYRYIADHTTYADEVSTAPLAAAVPAPAPTPATDVTPPPAAPLVQ